MNRIFSKSDYESIPSSSEQPLGKQEQEDQEPDAPTPPPKSWATCAGLCLALLSGVLQTTYSSLLKMVVVMDPLQVMLLFLQGDP